MPRRLPRQHPSPQARVRKRAAIRARTRGGHAVRHKPAKDNAMQRPRKVLASTVVEAELPSPTNPPKDLLKTIMWCVIAAGAAISLVLGINALRDHSAAADKEHDDQFVKKEVMEKHEREDIQSITKLAEATNISISKLTDAINLQSSNADVSRQWVRSSNLAVQASIADLIVRACRKDNLNSKDSHVCDKEAKAADEAAKDLKDQNAKANEETAKYQRIQIAPPVVVPPTITKGQ